MCIRDSYDTVFEYMTKANRPYSLINIHDNLHGQIKKGPLQKILDQLSSDGQLKMKEYGKAKVYLLNQENIPEVDKGELENLNNELNKRREKMTQLNDKTKELNARLKEILSAPTNEQLNQELKNYENLLKEAEDKLQIYESGNYVKVSDEEIKVAEEKKKKFETEYKKRKRMCMDCLLYTSPSPRDQA
eukprot:TRINITY_DN25129_c0_g1_i1.p1 TRINITY_DN25129_c0_g1~~TRINITY_DN25129_c0_g1_i1.p1  ORF type:complete len:189 (+),score=54.80 TRINITY_DN25129_c0_g1_i1:63-629(+)